MGATASSHIQDGALDQIALGNTFTVLTGEPSSIADIASFALAEVAVTPGDGNGDFTFAAGDISGRKVSMTAKADINIDTSGQATHVSVDDGTRWIATTVTSKALTAGDKTSIPAWDAEINAPVAS